MTRSKCEPEKFSERPSAESTENHFQFERRWRFRTHIAAARLGWGWGRLTMAAMAAAGDDEPVLDRSFRGHKGGVSCLAFSPTTRQLASGSGDCSVMVWNFKPQLRAFKLEVGLTPLHWARLACRVLRESGGVRYLESWVSVVNSRSRADAVAVC